MGRAHRIAASLLVLAGTGACRSVFGLDDPLPGDPGDAAGDGLPTDGPPIDQPQPLCATAGLTCAGNAVAFQCGDDCWVGCDDTIQHDAAATRCTQWGGKLAPFVLSTDQSCFRQHIQPSDDSWTGLVQMAGAANPSAGWSWNGDGLTPPLFNWLSGQPDDLDGTENDTQQCAQILDGTNKWQDVACTATFQFSCSQRVDN
jgi:lectin-like protein